MKITLTGSLGHISKPLAEALVKKGHQVTVISTNPEKKRDIEALGATAAIGSVEDAGFLTKAFTSADVVYTMIPPASYFNPAFDVWAYCDKLANNFVQAIRNSGVKRVVHLSSIGAHMDKGSGLILLHRKMEQALDSLSDVGITFMRPTGFYYNLYPNIGMIKQQGFIGANYGEDDRIVWVAPEDIAMATGEEIEAIAARPTPAPAPTTASGSIPVAAAAPTTGGGSTSPAGTALRKIRYVGSDELTCSETARILGEAIGKPDLKWLIIPGEQMLGGLIAAGMKADIAAGLVEMYAAVHDGSLREDYDRHRPALGKIKMTDFAKDFAAAYAGN